MICDRVLKRMMVNLEDPEGIGYPETKHINADTMNSAL